MEFNIEDIYKDLQITDIRQIKKNMKTHTDINYLVNCNISEIEFVPPYIFVSMNTSKLSKLSREKLLKLTHDQIKYLKPIHFQMVIPSIVKQLLDKYKNDTEDNLIGCYMPDNTIIPIKGQSVSKILEKGLVYSEKYFVQEINHSKKFNTSYKLCEKENGLIKKKVFRYSFSVSCFPDELSSALRYDKKRITLDTLIEKNDSVTYDYFRVIKYLNDNYIRGAVSSNHELTDIPKLYSLSEIASITNTRLTLIKHLIKTGILPYYKIPGIRVTLQEYYLAAKYNFLKNKKE